MSRKSGFAAVCLAAATLSASPPALAQSDILLRMQTGANDRFEVDSAGGMLSVGNFSRGVIPATGSGTRLMWYPGKSAFRAGTASGTFWDDASVGPYSWAGGRNTTASGPHSFAFGDTATATSTASVALGAGADATGAYAIALGRDAAASATDAFAAGAHATASGTYSVAIGYRAATRGQMGALVFADASVSDSVEATGVNQFIVRAAGGYKLYSNSGLTAGQTMAAGGSTWTVVSDRNRKQDFAAIDGEDLLARLRSVPVTTWRYRAEENRSVRHIGPMAQDWEAAFGFSHDTTMINTGDLDGVNLAGVKALEERTARQAALIQTQAAQIQAQDEQLRALAREVAELRALLREKAQQSADPAWR